MQVDNPPINSVDRKRTTHIIDDSPESVSPSRKVKKRRIVISSDEEEGQDEVKKTPARNADEKIEVETPKSTPRHRIILVDSDEEDNFVGFYLTDRSYFLF